MQTVEKILGLTWLIPLLPLFSFLMVGLFLRPISGKIAAYFATASVFTSAVLSYFLAIAYFQLNPQQTFIPWSFEWLSFDTGLKVNFGLLIDSISVMMLVVVTTVSTLVHLYSISYMHGDTGYGRYFTYLSLFTFSMLGLVLAPNIIQIYVFWELVGVSSFLLIGFYYSKPSAVAASKKAFIVTRFADLGFLIGVLILGYYGYQVAQTMGNAQPFDFSFINNPAVLEKMLALPNHLWGLPLFTIALILVYMGAAGKSAMFPLHIWLPDAMEGPTPVSALIHAATMVVAGVYLVARLFPAFASSDTALEVVAWVGLFTSAFAAIIACTQDDIKRVLAFSTLSQLGYMMFALGVAGLTHPLGYTASMFHLFTHAFFKALLFLGAGSVIHAVHSNDVWTMGGLRKYMPVTHFTFLIAVLAISGIYPFAGFFSKDEILSAALEGHRTVFFVVGMIVAALTAFYMSRIYFLTFWGKGRSEGAKHAHESPWLMLLPLVILSILSAVTGFIPFGKYVFVHEAHESVIHLSIAIPASLVAIFGIGFSYFMYSNDGARAKHLATSLGPIYTLIKQKFYIDEVYLFITHQIIFRFIAAPIAWFDRNIIDGGVNLTGWCTQKMSSLSVLIQSGQVQTYAFWLVLGAISILLFLAVGV